MNIHKNMLKMNLYLYSYQQQ